MPVYDVRCESCGWEEEIRRKSTEDNPPCGKCGGLVRVVWKTVPIGEKAKDPYNYLDGPIPSSQKIFSGPKVSSKTVKH